MLDGRIEGRKISVCSRLHHTALHHRQHKLRWRFQVEIGRKTVPRVFQTFLNRGRPSIEVVGQALVYVELLLGDLQRQTPDRTPVGAPRCNQIPPVEILDAKD